MSEELFVGRERALSDMTAAAEPAWRGLRQVLFVTGEAGIGKTSLVQAFLRQSSVLGGARITSGICVQHYGAGEPFQPLLEALTRLCQKPGGDAIIAVLERSSPDWLVQLPTVLTPARLAALRRRAVVGTSDRMLRQLNDGLEALAAKWRLVLWLEDIHWSDTSTLDWLASFAQRPDPARILLIATFRPPPAIEPSHPVASIYSTLRLKKFCRAVELNGLDEPGVIRYLGLRAPPSPDAVDAMNDLGRLIHRQTGGNPLFVVNVFDNLASRGLIIDYGGTWKVNHELRASDLGVPDDVRKMIEQQIDRLPPLALSILETSSVAGAMFSAAAVAAGAGASIPDVETTLSALASQTPLLRHAGPAEWPDGTVAARFEFVHVLYRDVTYDRIPPTVRGRLHGLIGERQEQAFGERAPEIAAELAMHFEHSRDIRKAGIYLNHAAENARRRCAYVEARLHYERALRLLELEPMNAERMEREVRLWNGLGSAVMATRGWSSPEAAEAYSRARSLGDQLGDTERLFPASFGLWLFYLGRGPLTVAQEIARDMIAAAHRSGAPDLLLQSSHASWTTAFLQGDIRLAENHIKAGLSFYDLERHAAMAADYGSHDAKVCGLAFLAWVLTLQGRTAEAVGVSNDALALASELAHPFSKVQTHIFAAEIAQARRDHQSAKMHASNALAIARDQDFRLMAAWASALDGWADAKSANDQQALQRVADALTRIKAIGNNSFLSYFLAVLADACLRCGEAAEGRKTVDQAREVVANTGEQFWEAEIHRLDAELRMAANGNREAPEIQQLCARAIQTAERQGANLLVAHARASLGRLCGCSEKDSEKANTAGNSRKSGWG